MSIQLTSSDRASDRFAQNMALSTKEDDAHQLDLSTVNGDKGLSLTVATSTRSTLNFFPFPKSLPNKDTAQQTLAARRLNPRPLQSLALHAWNPSTSAHDRKSQSPGQSSHAKDQPSAHYHQSEVLPEATIQQTRSSLSRNGHGTASTSSASREPKGRFFSLNPSSGPLDSVYDALPPTESVSSSSAASSRVPSLGVGGVLSPMNVQTAGIGSKSSTGLFAHQTVSHPVAAMSQVATRQINTPLVPIMAPTAAPPGLLTPTPILPFASQSVSGVPALSHGSLPGVPRPSSRAAASPKPPVVNHDAPQTWHPAAPNHAAVATALHLASYGIGVGPGVNPDVSGLRTSGAGPRMFPPTNPPIINTGNLGPMCVQPGDWVCTVCSFVNWRRRKVCMRCFPFAEGNEVSASLASGALIAAQLAAGINPNQNQMDYLARSRSREVTLPASNTSNSPGILNQLHDGASIAPLTSDQHLFGSHAMHRLASPTSIAAAQRANTNLFMPSANAFTGSSSNTSASSAFSNTVAEQLYSRQYQLSERKDLVQTARHAHETSSASVWANQAARGMGVSTNPAGPSLGLMLHSEPRAVPRYAIPTPSMHQSEPSQRSNPSPSIESSNTDSGAFSHRRFDKEQDHSAFNPYFDGITSESGSHENDLEPSSKSHSSVPEPLTSADIRDIWQNSGTAMTTERKREQRSTGLSASTSAHSWLGLGDSRSGSNYSSSFATIDSFSITNGVDDDDDGGQDEALLSPQDPTLPRPDPIGTRSTSSKRLDDVAASATNGSHRSMLV